MVVLAACGKGGGGSDEVKLGKRSKDAGPAVVFVDRPGGGGGATGSLEGAPLVAEKEPNDAKSGGQAVPIPARVQGRIDEDGDWDVYLVTTPTAGTLRAKLSGIPDADLILEVQAQNGELLALSDNGPAGTSEGIPNLFVQPGQVRLVVHEYVKVGKKGAKLPPRAAPSQPYTLEISLGPLPPAGVEREPNDEPGFAEELALGSEGRGFIGWKRDVDVWKVPLEGVRDDETLTVEVAGVPDLSLKVTVQDAAGATLVERHSKNGEGVVLRNLQVRTRVPAYYVLITSDRANDTDEYVVKASTSAAGVDEETEPNDTPEKANPLSDVPNAASGQRTGYLSSGDVDLFKLDPAIGQRVLSLIVEPPNAIDVDLAVVDHEGQFLAGPINNAKKGQPESLSGVNVASGQTVYVRVGARSGSSDTDKYRLKWTVAAGAAPTE